MIVFVCRNCVNLELYCLFTYIVIVPTESTERSKIYAHSKKHTKSPKLDELQLKNIEIAIVHETWHTT